jgi:hypothetical protein
VDFDKNKVCDLDEVSARISTTTTTIAVETTTTVSTLETTTTTKYIPCDHASIKVLSMTYHDGNVSKITGTLLNTGDVLIDSIDFYVYDEKGIGARGKYYKSINVSQVVDVSVGTGKKDFISKNNSVDAIKLVPKIFSDYCPAQYVLDFKQVEG